MNHLKRKSEDFLSEVPVNKRIKIISDIEKNITIDDISIRFNSQVISSKLWCNGTFGNAAIDHHGNIIKTYAMRPVETVIFTPASEVSVNCITTFIKILQSPFETSTMELPNGIIDGQIKHIILIAAPINHSLKINMYNTKVFDENKLTYKKYLYNIGSSLSLIWSADTQAWFILK